MIDGDIKPIQIADRPPHDLETLVDRKLIKQCVHCGLCLDYCPTYRALGVEMDSPRGRIYQVRQAVEHRIEFDNPNLALHLNQCLACRACETACPSGVQYGQIFEQARAQLPVKSPVEGVLRKAVLGTVFTHKPLLDAAGLGLRFYQKSGMQSVVRRSGVLKLFPQRLRYMESLLPEIQGGVLKPVLPKLIRARGKRRYRVAFLAGCVQSQFFGRTNQATVRVLARNGCDVVLPPEQSCCGALHLHSGDRATAIELAKNNIEAFDKYNVDYIINNASGCGSTLKEYVHLLHDDPEWTERARQFSAKVKDIAEFLGDVGLSETPGPVHARVTYQDVCHLRHAQRISEQPRALLRAIPGLELVEMKESDWCCGSAGIYTITQPALSTQILGWKVENVTDTAAHIVIASNPGCAIQIQAGLRKAGYDAEVMHIIDLLDRAYRQKKK